MIVPANDGLGRAVSLRELEGRFDERPGDFTPWFRQRVAELGLFESEA
jgi:hypothetical protein